MMILTTAIALANVVSCVAFAGLPLTARRLSVLNEEKSDSMHDSVREEDDVMLTRRETLGLVGSAAFGVLLSPNDAFAFPNKVSNQYDDRPKQRGSKVCCLPLQDMSVNLHSYPLFALSILSQKDLVSPREQIWLAKNI